MCFSAGASFGAGVVLSAISVVSFKNVKHPSQYAFAGIPLVFAMQQFTEGFLWLSLTHLPSIALQKATTYTFLFFAQIVWPVWVPVAILLMQAHDKRKSIQKILVMIGVTVSLYLAYCLVTYPVQANIIGYHIAYVQDYPAELSRYGGILYIMATVLLPFFSTIKRMWTLGVTILISYFITAIFYTDYIVSVWCFFASVISTAVLVILYQHNTSSKNQINKATALN